MSLTTDGSRSLSKLVFKAGENFQWTCDKTQPSCTPLPKVLPVNSPPQILSRAEYNVPLYPKGTPFFVTNDTCTTLGYSVRFLAAITAASWLGNFSTLAYGWVTLTSLAVHRERLYTPVILCIS
eukprot:Blabericola_migrator_1__5894@NODE_2983_length_2141_cov_70_559788_g1866_i0_p1_GENE_NODE_2983_length_2141_cov_70_559788_g1866_i0NODE_2983_length_2141_cov_70_559788_g1866_i0_p1_ORF_typecomplete_len124_score11_97_NODE_2983_length_2141_cov_70_559788_g1866_i012331604